MATAPELKRMCRQYKGEYLQYGFIHQPNNPQITLCLICDSHLTNHAMKPSKMKEHLANVHPSKAGQRLEYFKSLAERQEKKCNY